MLTLLSALFVFRGCLRVYGVCMCVHIVYVFRGCCTHNLLYAWCVCVCMCVCVCVFKGRLYICC